MLTVSTTDKLSLGWKINESPHIPLSLFELQKHHSNGKGELKFLGHGNALPWNFTSGTVPRVKHPEPANSQTGCGGRPEQARSYLPSSLCDPLWHSCVCILDVFPPNTSHSAASICPSLQSICCPLRLADMSPHHYAQHNTAGFDGSSKVTCGTGL